jgi:hypothetical protein
MGDLNFDPEFPEKFLWGLLDSRIAAALGARLAGRIRAQCKLSPEERPEVAGLRSALRTLWEVIHEQ